MTKPAVAVLAMLTLVPAVSRAQGETIRDTLTVTESTQIQWEGQTVDYFILKSSESELRFIEDSAYVMIVAFIDDVDSLILDEPIVWMKTSNPHIGDTWTGMFPLDGLLLTEETIVSTKQLTVQAGTFTVFEVAVWALDGTYLGQKYWSDGVGMVAWHLDVCNEMFDLELLSYDVAPGADFWPHTLGDEFAIETRWNASTYDADYRAITVDGLATDWAGITPAVQDPSGDDTTGFAGCDIRDIYVAADDTYLYLMADFWDGPPNTTWGELAVPAYAFILDDNGVGAYWGYGVSYESSPSPGWYVFGINLDATAAEVSCGSVIELRIPLTNLGFYGFELPGYFVATDGGAFDMSCYNTVRLPAFCPIVVSGDASGDGQVKSSDIIYLVNYVLKAGPEPVPCAAAGDVNADGEVKSSDIIYLVNYVLKGGAPPLDVCPLIPGTWTCP
jgi:hypothetical protein